MTLVVGDNHIRPRPLEVAAGVCFGAARAEVTLPRVRGMSARRALATSLLSGLQRPPCVVAFSGGRDSSALLALATEVARREGLAPPVPVTLRFPREKAADESDWQELVMRHLGLSDWIRLEYEEDELDYVGPVARQVLHEHGLLWPPNTHVHLPMLEQAGTGSLVDGVDGDSIFSSGFSPAIDLVRLRTRPSKEVLSNLRTAMRRRETRRARLLRGGPFLPWLTAEADAEAIGLLASDSSSEPFSYARRLSWFMASRYIAVLQATTELLAARTGTLVVRPFLDPAFLGAWGSEMGRTGFRGRTHAMRALFGDLVPARVIERQDKGMYWHYWGSYSRALAATWQGEGVDELYVDHSQLRVAWQSSDLPTPDHRSALLLQSVLLARLGQAQK